MNIKTIFLLSFIAFAGSVSADKQLHQFNHCTYAGGSGNVPHLFDISEVYSCDEGKIEIAGQTRQTIEYGHVYSTELGRPSREQPHVATDYDYKSNKWCATPTPWDKNQKERCGDKPTTCWDGKPATWDPNWRGYSCITPDHNGK
jgi:hypothetical protein